MNSAFMLWLRCRKIGRLIEELRIKNFLVFVFVVCVVFVVFVVSARFEISLQRYYIFLPFVGNVLPIITGGCIFSRRPRLLYLPFNEPLMGFNGD